MSPIDNKQIQVIICGRLLGEANDFAFADDEIIMYYEFRPISELQMETKDQLQPHNTSFDLKNGIIEQTNFAGEVLFRADLLETISKIPRNIPIEKVPE